MTALWSERSDHSRLPSWGGNYNQFFFFVRCTLLELPLTASELSCITQNKLCSDILQRWPYAPDGASRLIHLLQSCLRSANVLLSLMFIYFWTQTISQSREFCSLKLFDTAQIIGKKRIPQKSLKQSHNLSCQCLLCSAVPSPQKRNKQANRTAHPDPKTQRNIYFLFIYYLSDLKKTTKHNTLFYTSISQNLLVDTYWAAYDVLAMSRILPRPRRI